MPGGDRRRRRPGARDEKPPAKPAASAAGDSLAALTAAALEFRDAREWKQFHNFKDLAVTLALEAAEVLEHAQWKTPAELEKHLAGPPTREDVADELADVLHVLLLLAEHGQIDLAEAFRAKLKKTAKKYPVEKARGSAKKYTELNDQ
jgi:NTP pyrophosphatase (non-canonical NTP hydrolase)